MIYADDITVQVPGWREPVTILREQTILFPAMERVSILARAGSGRTTLARVFGGVKRPRRGKVLINGSVGWPIGYSAFFNPNLTVAENIQHLAGLIDVPFAEFSSIITWMCEDDSILDRILNTLPPSERAVVIYAASLAVPNDYIISDDKVILGDAKYARKSEQLLNLRLKTAGLLFISRNGRLLSRWCDRHYVLIEQKLVSVSDPSEGQKLLDEQEIQRDRA